MLCGQLSARPGMRNGRFPQASPDEEELTPIGRDKCSEHLADRRRKFTSDSAGKLSFILPSCSARAAAFVAIAKHRSRLLRDRSIATKECRTIALQVHMESGAT
jgi:hypothetical protein